MDVCQKIIERAGDGVLGKMDHTTEKNLCMARLIAEKVAEKGGRVYYVGGYVRDQILGKENKDVDLEVHGVTPEELFSILNMLGNCIAMGASFGIYGLRGYDLDIAMPRKAELRGDAREFAELTDPFIGTYQAALRRDFTMNALMQDVLTGEIIDHFQGVSDLKKGILRHVSDDTFAEDPLRVIRAAQFASRFDFSIADETVKLCSALSLKDISWERIYGEISKVFQKSPFPSRFFLWLRKMDQLKEWFPELEALIGIEQNPKYHPEGDVWTHTMQVLDYAAEYRDQVSYSEGFLMAALTHDFGKIVCTTIQDGVIHAYKHEVEGLPIVKRFLRRINNEVKLNRYVLNMVEYHMRANMLAETKASSKSCNRLFDLSVSPMDLLLLSVCDRKRGDRNEAVTDSLLYMKERLAEFEELMARPYVMGKDLVQAGLKPDKNFSAILEYSHKLRLAGVEKEAALKQTLAYARTEYGICVQL